MNWVIIGGNGWIGNKLIQEIQRVRGQDKVIVYDSYIKTAKDILPLIDLIQKENICRVVDCVGRTHGNGINSIDYLQGNLKINMYDNLFVHYLILLACQVSNVHLSILGTGCIYSSVEECKHFFETDAPNFFDSEYSIVKGVLDQMIQCMFLSLTPKVLHLRIRMPIDVEPHPRNLLTKLASYSEVTDFPNSMTVLSDMIPIMARFMISQMTGVFNMVNPGTITHPEILSMYKDLVNPAHHVSLFTLEEQKAKLKEGRSDNVLSTEALETACFTMHDLPPPLPVQLAIRNCLEQYAKSNCGLLNPMKKVLVTGGSGFLGTHLIDFLSNQFPEIELIVNIDKQASTEKVERIIHIQQNICDHDKMLEYFRRFQFDTVFHLAAETHVDQSFNKALVFTESNVFGTHVLLECARQVPVKKFIHCSTDEVYGGCDALQHENSITLPTNPYAASKAGAEALCHAYIKSFKLPVIIVRANNFYGPGQLPEKVIPAFICRRFQGLPLYIQGEGNARRFFLYVDDAVSALLTIQKFGIDGEVYNIGSREELSIFELAYRIVNEIPADIDLPIRFTKDREFQDLRYYIADFKLRRLGWVQNTTFTVGLKKTIEWFRSRQSLYDVATLNPFT